MPTVTIAKAKLPRSPRLQEANSVEGDDSVGYFNADQGTAKASDCAAFSLMGKDNQSSSTSCQPNNAVRSCLSGRLSMLG